MTAPSWRILVTGSRDYSDRRAVGDLMQRALYGSPPELVVKSVHGPRMLWERVTLVHGAARGADSIAASIAAAWGMTVEAHPADWSIGRRAGPERNARMVALGADVMIAFPLGRSVGTRGCMALAKRAGIPIIVAESSDGNGERSTV